MKICFTLFVVFLTRLVFSQPYVDGGNTRHRFAQLTLGADYRTFLSAQSRKTVLNEAGLAETSSLTNQGEARLIIGGTHFWGHADFYVAIPVAAIGKSGLTTGAETGARYFPWRIENKKLRPFLGLAVIPYNYQQGNGAKVVRTKCPLTAGFMFNYKNHLFEIASGYSYDNGINYYIDPSTSVLIKTQPFWFSLGYKYRIETTLGAEKDWQSGRTARLTDTLGKLGRLNGFTLAVGPSSASFLKNSTHNQSAAPFIDNHKLAKIFPEFGLGYYIHSYDLQFNFSYRNISSEIGAYGYKQIAKRQALTFEAYKFVADYHGFAVFVGPCISQEWLKVKETNLAGETETATFQGLKPGITFGWDIRPNRIQSWYLRTNLRWIPNLNVKMSDGQQVSLDQLEFNFIQFVAFPGRFF